MTSDRLRLPDVTLCCVDTRAPSQALYAMRRSLSQVEFGEALLISTEDAKAHLPSDRSVRLVTIPPLKSIDEYSRFMLTELRHHISSDYVLVIQWDGFVVDRLYWRDEFLKWDYIGAPWYHGKSLGGVGNGGFSLRSKRLLNATRGATAPVGEPEDATICVHQRRRLEQDHGIRIAPVELASEFSCEYGPYRRSFGFHGMHNFAHVMPRTELDSWLSTASDEVIKSVHARKLVKALMHSGRAIEALQLIERRRRLLGRNRDHYVLKVRCWAHLLRTRR